MLLSLQFFNKPAPYPSICRSSSIPAAEQAFSGGQKSEPFVMSFHGLILTVVHPCGALVATACRLSACPVLPGHSCKRPFRAEKRRASILRRPLPCASCAFPLPGACGYPAPGTREVETTGGLRYSAPWGAVPRRPAVPCVVKTDCQIAKMESRTIC